MAWSAVGVLRRWAAETPDAPMLTGMAASGGTVTRTWRDVDRRANRVAAGLLAEGIGAGDRVALLDKNGLAYFDVLFGGSKINAVNVAVNWRLAAPEIAHIINDAEARIVFVSTDFMDAFAQIEDELTTVRKVIVIEGGHPKHDGLEAWLAGSAASSDPGAEPGIEPAEDDIALQLYTSGTTGLPKGVMLSNANMGSMIPGFASALELVHESVNLAAMPLFHIGGSGWALFGLANGCHTILVRDVDPAVVLEKLEAHRVTHAFLVPAVLQFMLSLALADADLSALHKMVYGASPITDDVLVRCMAAFGCDFVQVYGMTETTGAITLLPAADHDPAGPHADRLRSCGVALEGVEIRIVDPDTGADKPVGEVGELWTRSSQNMVGYWNKPAETAKTVTADGWLKTGDAGFFDADGFIYLHDRIKDMIVSGGENIYPAEVENALMSHPDVADVAVIGVPSDRWGETVKAVVVLAPGVALDETGLIAHCRGLLAHYKCPTSVDEAASLPRNPSGKLLKRELRAPYWEGRTRNIG